MRRSKGEGSIYKRKDGSWVAQYEAGGKRRYFYGKTKKAVADKLREKLSSGETDLALDADIMLVGAYLDRWLSAIRGTVKERTWERYEGVVRLHVRPVIGGTKLLKLAPLDVQELYRSKLDSGLSPRSVQIMHATLYKALKEAVRWSLVTKNVAGMATPPRSRKKEIRTLSPEETRRLLNEARGERFEALYVLAVTTGMRQGELLGLRWDDVDLSEGVVRVNRTLWKGETTSPKTARANRSIRLTIMAVEALKGQKDKCGGAEWVFSTRSGTPVNRHNLVNRSWWPLLRRSGLPRILFHNLRHTAATLLLSRDTHPKLVQ